MWIHGAVSEEERTLVNVNAKTRIIAMVIVGLEVVFSLLASSLFHSSSCTTQEAREGCFQK
jgi:hypothetical protein